MDAPRRQRGTTLIEAMVAMLVLLVGAVGLLGAHRQGLRLSADGRHVTRASALAQDLVEQMALWPYGDPRLTPRNYTLANATAVGDPTFAFEGVADPVGTGLADYGDANLGAAYGGIQALPPGYQRFWNVACVDDIDGNGVPDVCRIAVIVRWGDAATGYRRVVSFTTKLNPNP